jgi:capsular polysaccharide biosynthesis protein
MLIPEKQPIKDSRDLSVPMMGLPALQQRPIPPVSRSEIDVVDTLERRWLLAVSILVVFLAVGYKLIHHYVKPSYQAETTVYVSPSALKDNAEHVNELSYVTLINQQILTVTHYDTLSAAMRRLDAEVHWKLPGETEQAAIERLRQSISVARVPDSYEISIAASGPDPTNLAQIANAVADAYLEKGRGDSVSERASRLATLTMEKASVEKDLNEKVETASQYSGKLQVVDLDRAMTFPDDAVLAQMRVALAAARQKRIEAEQQLAVDERSGAATEAEQILMSDGSTQKRLDVLLQRQSELRTRMDGMRPANPLHKAAEKELASVDSQLQSVPADMARTIAGQLIDKLHTQVDQSRLIEQALSNEVTEDAMTLEKTSHELRDARALNADIERLRGHLRDVQEHIDTLNLQAETPGFLSIFSVAQRPLQPLKNQKQKALGTLLALALALSILFPVTIDALDSRVHNPVSVEHILGFLPVGMTIAKKPGKEEFAEEHLRRIASGIQRAIARGAKTVLLTPLKSGVPSALANEIARVLKERGFRPVLFTPNSQRPVPDEGVGGRARLTALGLNISMLKSSEQDCDVVLISAPPLLMSSDAELLATEADVTLMVVEAGKNTRRDVERAGRLLERLRVSEVGVILTSVRVERAGRLIKSELRDYRSFRSAVTEA